MKGESLTCVTWFLGYTWTKDFYYGGTLKRRLNRSGPKVSGDWLGQQANEREGTGAPGSIVSGSMDFFEREKP